MALEGSTAPLLAEEKFKKNNNINGNTNNNSNNNNNGNKNSNKNNSCKNNNNKNNNSNKTSSNPVFVGNVSEFAKELFGLGVALEEVFGTSLDHRQEQRRIGIVAHAC